MQRNSKQSTLKAKNTAEEKQRKEIQRKKLQQIAKNLKTVGEEEIESAINEDYFASDSDEEDLYLESEKLFENAANLDESLQAKNNRMHTSQLDYGFDPSEFRNRIALLTEENLKKDALIETLRKEKMNEVMDLEEKLKNLLHEKQMLDMKLADETRKAENKFKAQQDKFNLELTAVKSKLQEIDSKNPLLKERFAEAREELKDLTLSEARYIELKSLPEDQYSFRDFVLVRVFEMNEQHRVQKEQLRKEVENLSERVMLLEKENEQKDKALRLGEEKERALAREIYNWEKRSNKLQQELNERISVSEELSVKSQNYEQLKSKAEKLEKEVTFLANEKILRDTQFDQVQADKEDAIRRCTEEMQKLELLKMDKVYLIKEADTYKIKLQNLEERTERQHKKLKELKRIKETLYQQLLKAREDQKTNYEQKFQSEVDKIRTQTATDLENIRTSSKEVYDRESRQLKEARDAAYTELERTKLKLQESKQSYDELMNEYRSLQSTFEGKISELTSQLKLKSFETERTMMTHEETVANLKQCNLIVDQQRKKIEVITAEYYQLQNDTTKQITELQTTLNEQQAKLSAFEGIEKDLDMALLATNEIDLEKDTLLSSFSSTTANQQTKRKMRQTLLLSKKLLDIQRINQELNRALEEEKRKVAQLTDELQNANDLLKKTQQPYGYLVDSIRERDELIVHCKEQIAELEQQQSSWKTEKEHLLAELNDMRVRHKQLDGLKNLVDRLQARMQEQRKDEQHIKLSDPAAESQLQKENINKVSNMSNTSNFNASTTRKTTKLTQQKPEKGDDDLNSDSPKLIRVVSTSQPKWVQKLKL